MADWPINCMQDLRDAGMFRPVQWCARCGCMVSKWHKHYTDPGESIEARRD